MINQFSSITLILINNLNAPEILLLYWILDLFHPGSQKIYFNSAGWWYPAPQGILAMLQQNFVCILDLSQASL